MHWSESLTVLPFCLALGYGLWKRQWLAIGMIAFCLWLLSSFLTERSQMWERWQWAWRQEWETERVELAKVRTRWMEDVQALESILGQFRTQREIPERQKWTTRRWWMR